MRKSLHQAIDRENDEDFLLLLKNVVDQKSASYTSLSIEPDQVKELKTSYGEYKANDVMSIDEANQMIDQWPADSHHPASPGRAAEHSRLLV